MTLNRNGALKDKSLTYTPWKHPRIRNLWLVNIYHANFGQREPICVVASGPNQAVNSACYQYKKIEALKRAMEKLELKHLEEDDS
jgi:hypothetical protein